MRLYSKMDSAVLSFAVGVSFAFMTACGGGDFDPASKIQSVRVLATQVDKPYAKPGETVNLEVISYDGRADRSRPMTIYWIPFVCKNPRNDLYYACFNQIPLLPVASGQDLSSALPKGPTYSFKMPDDAISSHTPTPGTEPYGLTILFNIACAGHVEIITPDPANGPQAVPLGCFDDNHVQLGPDDYVLGFVRVYAYESRRNENPVVANLLVDGAPIDPKAGLTISACDEAIASCPKLSIDVDVPSSSAEVVPDDIDPDGQSRREQIWVGYFTTDGSFEGDARLLYDARKGKVDGSATKYAPPAALPTRDSFLWAVVHDNRGGVGWVQVPIHVK